MNIDNDWEFKANHWEQMAQRLIVENNELKNDLLLSSSEISPLKGRLMREALIECIHLIEAYTVKDCDKARKALDEFDRIYHPSKATTPICEEVQKYRSALELIAGPRDCGCSPVCQCNSQESLEIEVEALRDIAIAALSNAKATA